VPFLGFYQSCQLGLRACHVFERVAAHDEIEGADELVGSLAERTDKDLVIILCGLIGPADIWFDTE